jgi:MGT family glycosyltransferase
VVLYNYPAALHAPERTALLPPRHAFLGSAVRRETPDHETAAWLEAADDQQLVVVTFGTFLSARRDVLARVAAALRRVDVRVAMAIGGNDPAILGQVPADWLVRASLPQVALLERADLLVTHGGNNSVTEALSHAVPMLVMPFSTDQFDGAAAVERHLAGVALDANGSSPSIIAGSIRGLLGAPPAAPRHIAAGLQAQPGPEVAYAALTGSQRQGSTIVTSTTPVPAPSPAA